MLLLPLLLVRVVSLLPCCMLVVFLMPVPVAVSCLLCHVVELPQCSGIKALPIVCLLVCVGAHLDASRITAPLPCKSECCFVQRLLFVRAFCTCCSLISNVTQGPCWPASMGGVLILSPTDIVHQTVFNISLSL